MMARTCEQSETVGDGRTAGCDKMERAKQQFGLRTMTKNRYLQDLV